MFLQPSIGLASFSKARDVAAYLSAAVTDCKPACFIHGQQQAGLYTRSRSARFAIVHGGPGCCAHCTGACSCVGCTSRRRKWSRCVLCGEQFVHWLVVSPKLSYLRTAPLVGGWLWGSLCATFLLPPPSRTIHPLL